MRQVCYAYNMSARGGVATAAGLGFQYLAALNDALAWMINANNSELILRTEDPTHEIIDYSISLPNGERVLSVQAKSSVDGPLGPKMGTSEALSILKRLVANPSRLYAIRTNRTLTGSCADLEALLAKYRSHPTKSHDIKAELSEALPDKYSSDISTFTNNELYRLNRAVIDSTPISAHALTDEIKSRTRELRRIKGLGIGLKTSEVLVGYLTSKLLELSSQRQDRSLSTYQLQSLLQTEPPALHGAAGTVDWGVPVGPVPKVQTITRTKELSEIIELIDSPPGPENNRNLSITGLSGIGKSILASATLDSTRHFYDRILWVDSHNDESIRNGVCQYLGIDSDNSSHGEVCQTFKYELSSSPATWLLIFDNAPDAKTLRDWIPATGAVDVITTSTDSTGWGATWHQLPLGTMSDDEALEMVKNRLNYLEFSTAQYQKSVSLCRELGNWPLALELACAFLADTGRGIEMTPEYLHLLQQHIIDEESLIPSEYRTHKSLLQAILVAFDNIELGSAKPTSLRPSALLAALSYLPARAAPFKIAGRVAVAVESELGHLLLTADELANYDTKIELTTEIALRELSRSSLVQHLHLPETSLQDFVLTNEIVLSVFRQLHNDQEQKLFLEHFQRIFNGIIWDALSDYQFKQARSLISSVLSSTYYSIEYESITVEGVTLIGNMASLHAQLDSPHEALHLYQLELRILISSQLQAPVIYSKIYASILALKIRLNRSIHELKKVTDLALYNLAQCVVDEDMRTSASEAASQVFHYVQQMKILRLPLDSKKIDSWEKFLMSEYPSADPDLAYDRLQAELKQVDNDDAGTLRSIEVELDRDLPPSIRQPLLFLKADALASLARFDASLEAFTLAISESRESGLGLSNGWTAILNAWRTAGLSSLGLSDKHAYAYCKALDEVTSDEEPNGHDDAIALGLCRLMSRVYDQSIESVSLLFDKFASLKIEPTILRPAPDMDSAVVEGCRRILAIRNVAGGAQLVPLESWGRARVPQVQGEVTGIVVAVDSSIVRRFPESGLNGHWLETEDGMGLFIKSDPPILVLSPLSGTGWLDIAPGSDRSEALVRLREIFRSEEFSIYFEHAIVGVPISGDNGDLIDSSGPMVFIDTVD